ncbi:MAG: hypothetical protein ACYCX8_10040, partial [Acidimicrobiales bacterium]
MHEDGDIAEERERIGSLVGLEIHGDKADDPLQHMVAILDAYVLTHRGEQLRVAHPRHGVVSYVAIGQQPSKQAS